MLIRLFKEDFGMMEPKIYLVHQFISFMNDAQVNEFMGTLKDLIDNIGEVVTQNL